MLFVIEKIVITMAPDSAVFTQFEFVTFSLLEDVVHQIKPAAPPTVILS